MSEGRIDYRGRRVPRNHFYDQGEEPFSIGPAGPRAGATAYAYLLLLSLLFSFAYFSGFGGLVPRHDAVFYPAMALAWTVFYGWGWIVRKMPLLAWLIALPVALATLAVPGSLFGFLFYKLWIE
jgi:hypothetical protein